MSHLVAYFGNEPDNMACALFSARSALYSRGPSKPEGFGLGFVQGGDVLLTKRPRAETAEVDLYGLIKDLHADALVGRVGLGQDSTSGSKSSKSSLDDGASGKVANVKDGGGRAGDREGDREGNQDDANTAAEDADPFRFRSWLFGSVGQVSPTGFESVREKLLESVPAFLRRNIRGKSPSEHIFHLFLAFLHDAGILDQPSPPPAAVHGALRNSVAFLDRMLAEAGSESIQLALVATNGRVFVAAGCSYPMRYLNVEGISDCPVCHGKGDMDRNGRRVPHESLRAVILEANRAVEGRSGWHEIPDRSALIIGADRVPQISGL